MARRTKFSDSNLGGSKYVAAAVDPVRANPLDLDALVVIGSWFLVRDLPAKALESFHLVTRTDPKYPGIWRLKAKASEALGDTKNAATCRRRGSDRRS